MKPMHYGFDIRQKELFSPSEEEINASLDKDTKYDGADTCEVL